MLSLRIGWPRRSSLLASLAFSRACCGQGSLPQNMTDPNPEHKNSGQCSPLMTQTALTKSCSNCCISKSNSSSLGTSNDSDRQRNHPLKMQLSGHASQMPQPLASHSHRQARKQNRGFSQTKSWRIKILEPLRPTCFVFLSFSAQTNMLSWV